MSQTATIISVSPLPYGNDWLVLFQYQLDSGGLQQSEIIVGNVTPSAFGYPPTVAFWASAASTVQVSPNPPGTTNPVVLPCPGLVQTAAFGLPLK
jgi:hypothetical protein